MAMKNGKWVVFEGIGCSGKSTQIKFTEEYLLNQGIKVLRTREPGGDSASEEIRRMIFELGGRKLLSPDDELTLFFTARRFFTRNVVFNNIKKGASVITDRWATSSKAYQGYAGGVDQKKIDNWTTYVCEDGRKKIFPDAVVLLDIDLATYKKRLCNRGTDGDPFDDADEVFINKLIKGYRKLAKDRWPDKTPWYTINGNLTQDAVWNQVKLVVNTIWGLR